MMMNPFRFGDPVEGKHYLARPDLDKVVADFLSNRIHVVLMGPRRFGKTSFVFNLLKNLEKEGYTCLFVDIFNITSHRDFLQQIFRALKIKKSWANAAKDWLASLYPKFFATTDPISGQVSFDLSLIKTSDKDIKRNDPRCAGWT